MNSNEYTIEGGTEAERNQIVAQISMGKIVLNHFTDGTGVPHVIDKVVVIPAKLPISVC